MRTVSLSCCFTALSILASVLASSPARAIDNPVLFVTQLPIPADFVTIGSTFGNHRATMKSVGRGGDLWIRYPNGTQRNLTAAAGFGMQGFQGARAIAVRDPVVHWSGNRALFSMVVGAPTRRYFEPNVYWQLYEIKGLRANQQPTISRVAGQPANANNVTPVYTSDDHILFTSDRPRNGAAHLYPQLDEYELTATNTGIWRLDTRSRKVRLLNHAPSGNFTPIVDSYGRVIFTQWDHLQRDQLADIDAGPVSDCYDGRNFGTFDYANESRSARILPRRTEIFPEPRPCRDDLLRNTSLNGHLLNHFFPWQMRQNGREIETLNHIGRQELHGYIPAAINDDPNIIEYYGQIPRNNPNDLEIMLHVTEDAKQPGRYLGTQAPEFGTHSAGQIVALSGQPNRNAEDMKVQYITHPDTAKPSTSPRPNHTGLYRNPVRLSDGTYLAVHTAETREDRNVGTRTRPRSLYNFRIKRLVGVKNGSYARPGRPLTNGIVERISYWDPDQLVTYDGPLWEMQAVEVRARPRPPLYPRMLNENGYGLVAQAGINTNELRQYLQRNQLALIAGRDVTVRDDEDFQQPFNLQVPSGTSSIGASGKKYEATYLQILQADQLRGLTYGGSEPRPGRRVLPRYLHDSKAVAANPSLPRAPQGSVAIEADGSFAAFVPAARALSWQLTDTGGEPVVRERYWLTMQPGEVRVCGSCHGVNRRDQAGQVKPRNAPLALKKLLNRWRNTKGN